MRSGLARYFSLLWGDHAVQHAAFVGWIFLLVAIAAKYTGLVSFDLPYAVSIGTVAALAAAWLWERVSVHRP